MGDVIVVFRVMPKSVDIDLNRIKDEIQEKIKPERIEEVPIAFGLNALRVTKFIPEKGGELERVERTLRTVKGVSNAEVVEVSRSL